MTTVYGDLHNAIVAHYEAQAYGVPYHGDNMPWTPLTSPAEHHVAMTAWEDAVEAGFGASRGVFEVLGLHIVGVKVPIETGWAPALDRAHAIADAFQYTTVGGAEMLEAAIVRIGRQGSYYRYNVHLPFRAFESAGVASSGGGVATDPAAAATAMSLRFDAEVALPNSLLTAYENMPFELPGAEQVWCAWSIRHAEGQGEIGTRRFSVPGQATASIYIPIETGTADGYSLAGATVTAFRYGRHDGINFGTPSLTRIGRAGPASSTEWWQVNVRCPYWFEYDAA